AVMREGFAASMNMLMIAVGALIAQYFIIPFGDAAVAGQGVGLRINQLFLLPLIGLSSAIMAIAGQANGAKLGERVLATYAQLIFWGVSGMIVVAIYIGFSAEFWSQQFSDDVEVQRLTVLYLYVSVPMMPVWAFVFLSQSFCQSLKKPFVATWVNITRQIPFPFIFVPLAFFALGASPFSVWIGVAVGNVFGAIFIVSYCVWIAPKVTGKSWLSTKLWNSNSAD
ncbi:MAG: MATE family efflux transporter, partial [Alphaproteobacteria bacterium]